VIRLSVYSEGSLIVTIQKSNTEPLPEFSVDFLKTIENERRPIWFTAESDQEKKLSIFSGWGQTYQFLMSFDPEYLSTLFEVPSAVGIAILDGKGNILLKKGVDVSSTESIAIAEDLYQEKLIQDGAVGVLSREIKILNKMFIVAVSRIPDVSNSFIYVETPSTQINEMVLELGRSLLPFVMIVTGVALLLALFFSGKIVEPIELLKEATSNISRGNWKVNIGFQSNDELGDLVNSFRHMGSELESRESDLIEANQKLVNSERLAVLGKFGAGIAHEVKNPLNAILGFAQLLDRKLGPDADSDMKKYVGFILDETRRSAKIITELLTFSRQKIPNLEKKNVFDIVKKSVEISELQATDANVKLKFCESVAEAYANVDSDQIMQVLTNLIGNAIHALEKVDKDSRNIEVDVKSIDKGDGDRFGKYIEISIADTGSGIEEDNLNKIFEPFFTTKEAGKGTGLGLAMCHGIIQQHSGEISVKSKIDVGTTFAIKLNQIS